jgi:hypothetical protein
MNHQPFENWLFDHKELSPLQHQQLKSHLEQCKKCQQLASAWHLVERQIDLSTPASPRPGFTDRWCADLPARKAAHQKDDGRRWLIGLSSGAALTLLILIVLNSNTQSISHILGSVANLYTRLAAWISQIRNFIFILANTIPSYVWVAIIVALVSWLVVAGLVWTYALTHVKKGVVTNETPA